MKTATDNRGNAMMRDSGKVILVRHRSWLREVVVAPLVVMVSSVLAALFGILGLELFSAACSLTGAML